MSVEPVVLDLYCGAGGAAKGYADAGFRVIGVDSKPQPRFPYEFYQADAIDWLKAMAAFGSSGIDAIHASPPCMKYSTAAKRFRTDRLHTYPDLIAPTRELLKQTGLPYVIENVLGSPLIDPVILCGSQFSLTSYWPNVGLPGTVGKSGKVGLRRHRLFEASFPIVDAGPHDHSYPAVPVYGYTNNRLFRGKGYHGESFEDLRQEVMGIDWMDHEELNRAIPPAYAQHVGICLKAYLSRTELKEAA